MMTMDYQLKVVEKLIQEIDKKVESLIVNKCLKLKLIKEESEYYARNYRNKLYKIEDAKYGTLLYLEVYSEKIFLLGIIDYRSSYDTQNYNQMKFEFKHYDVEPKHIKFDFIKV